MTDKEALTFPKSSRLLNKRSYKPVFDHGNKVSTRFLLLLYRENAIKVPRLGLVIAKKRVKHAAQRNRIKRLIRESFRLHQHQLPACDIVALARQGLDELSNEELRKQLEKQWQRLIKQCAVS